jgi:HK97 family phage major capsid protein
VRRARKNPANKFRSLKLENPNVLEQKRSNLARTAGAILDRAIREGRALRPGEDAEVTSLEMKIESINRTLGIYTRLNEDTQEPGQAFVRCVRSLAGRRNLDEAVMYATGRRWPETARALAASVATSGGFAVPQGYSGEVIESLKPLVAVRKLNPVTVSLKHGNYFSPRIAASSTVGYSQENTTIPATQPQFRALQLSARKMVALVPISNVLLRNSDPSADLIIRDDLTAVVSSVEDYYFIRGDGTQDTPRGLRYWALDSSNVFASSGTTIADIESDLSTMESALVNANVRMLRPGWIMSPRTELYLRSLRDPSTTAIRAFPEMTTHGTLKGKPYATSTNVPINLGGGSQTEIYLADFADVVIGENPLIIDGSGAGLYTDSGNNTVSAFAQDQTLVRVISQHDLGMRHMQSVAVLTGVGY